VGAVVFSFLIAYYTNWLYSNGHHRKQEYKVTATIFGGLSGILIYFSRRLFYGYLKEDQEKIDIGYWSWYNLFFWSIFTHPLLDCLTVYGTQLFAPFSNHRVALNNISVADPA